MSHITQPATILTQRRRLLVRGIVQGVGFRPWIHALAHAHRLCGFVQNSGDGVTIEVEGSDDAIAGFIAGLRSDPPPLAMIDAVDEQFLPEPAGFHNFEIRESQRAAAFVLVPPDIATCDACMADFRDPANRRFGYPFTNCTHCGPRYTIIRDVPYDRPVTTMAGFPMCEACAAEYHDPSNRRFHAQPNACPECGPWLELWDREKLLASRGEALGQTRQRLASGDVVAIKGLGGFHLACLASSSEAVTALRTRKRRSGKPFAVMARDLATAARLAITSDTELGSLVSARRPIVLLRKRADAPVAHEVAPGLDEIGIMLPYTPLHHLLFDGAPYDALVMTSANVSEEPIASRNEEVAPRLHALADFFLLHNRPIHTPADDSVVRVAAGREQVMRRSRGFAPLPIDLGTPVNEILACGGDLKNVFCLTRQHFAILSQHIGDLENLETLELFRSTLVQMQSFFRVSPVAVAHDLHPGYHSTRFALSLEAPERIGVQHHHAHIASCMAENRLEGKVIGLALDGTGYGTDGKIWGGEVLVCDYSGFERPFHFRYVPLPGGDTAVREPWRSALAYLHDAALEPSVLQSGREAVDAARIAVAARMIERRFNTVETSSCGRLFDAVAAILGVRRYATFEGQGAMELEALARGAPQEDAALYPYEIADGQIDFRETIRAMLANRDHPARAAASFHATLASALAEACSRVAATTGITRVCLSGGSLQNQILLSRTVDLLRARNLDVYCHHLVPANDGGLSLGQAMIANHRIGQRETRPLHGSALTSL
ncbi:MAG: carbamoyltransferase HypF [Bryobacteraceae bacterium]